MNIKIKKVYLTNSAKFGQLRMGCASPQFICTAKRNSSHKSSHIWIVLFEPLQCPRTKTPPRLSALKSWGFSPPGGIQTSSMSQPRVDTKTSKPCSRSPRSHMQRDWIWRALSPSTWMTLFIPLPLSVSSGAFAFPFPVAMIPFFPPDPNLDLDATEVLGGAATAAAMLSDDKQKWLRGIGISTVAVNFEVSQTTTLPSWHKYYILVCSHRQHKASSYLSSSHQQFIRWAPIHRSDWFQFGRGGHFVFRFLLMVIETRSQRFAISHYIDKAVLGSNHNLCHV